MIEVAVKVLHAAAQVPHYMSGGAAGADLFACLTEPIEIEAGSSAAIPTGLALEIPDGYAGFVFARSGLSTRAGLAPANKVGVIDSDYRGEVSVWLFNHSAEKRTVRPGDRIAQIVFLPVPQAHFVLCDCLGETDRGGGGFGSTGR